MERVRLFAFLTSTSQRIKGTQLMQRSILRIMLLLLDTARGFVPLFLDSLQVFSKGLLKNREAQMPISPEKNQPSVIKLIPQILVLPFLLHCTYVKPSNHYGIGTRTLPDHRELEKEEKKAFVDLAAFYGRVYGSKTIGNRHDIREGSVVYHCYVKENTTGICTVDSIAVVRSDSLHQDFVRQSRTFLQKRLQHKRIPCSGEIMYETVFSLNINYAFDSTEGESFYRINPLQENMGVIYKSYNP